MSLKISQINIDPEESIVLKATSKTNLIQYAITDLTFDDKGKQSNLHKHFYRFPAITVNEGDLIYLVTRKTKEGYFTTKHGPTVYRFSMGLDTDIWNNDGDKVELLQVQTLEEHPVKPQEL